jgi:hypothetical protein
MPDSINEQDRPIRPVFNCVMVLWNASFYAIMSNELEAESLISMIHNDMKSRGVTRLPVLTIVPFYFDRMKDLLKIH